MLSKVMRTAFFALLAVMVIAASKPPVEIVNSGSTNTPGYTIIIEYDGHVYYHIEPRRIQIISLNGTGKQPSSNSGTNGIAKLPQKKTKNLYYHIEQCEPFSKLTVTTCIKSVSFGYSLKLTYKEQTTPDLTCSTNDKHLAKLATVVKGVISKLKI